MEKKVKMLENKVLKFGNTHINSQSLREMTKDEFLEVYESKISTGAKEALKEVRKYLKK
tara:strand:+ start:729 stop:905 length:177 start_codon:yes stop_codon:yes gene_type:complete